MDLMSPGGTPITIRPIAVEELDRIMRSARQLSQSRNPLS